ncbi:hypothetical protein EUTSA_v10000034mg [Eutrema salsugineum]|uniref:Uncharacterized protein n=1 Tax=Eutrema salsugineum TaxID=72664 RepID=V4LUT7_EUTSA|nr:hypothetical protein EUTSA_v10000034mg [Eutrema salsugineum]
MSTIHISLSFLLLFVFSFHDVFAAPTRHLCRPEQRDALLEFKNEFEIRKPSFECYVNGSYVRPYPKTESWANNTDCCYWDGIKCDAKSGEVIELDLSCSCLYGKFRSNTSLFRLHSFRFLTTLYFSGEIPSSIGNLSLLTSLYLSFNQFLGQIPSSIGNLSLLTSLHLSYNGFSGEILSSIGNLSLLTSLHLSYNGFSGEIPSSIKNLSQLTFLKLSSNQFSGQIPSSIKKLSHLQTLHLRYNKFTGEIPDSFASLKNLTELDVSFNKLSGNFPIWLLNLTKLSYLSLEYNQLTGTLPSNISSLSNLRYFWARDNDFVGTIPSSLFTIPSLTRIYLSNNQLNGTLEFGNISSPTKLEWLELGGNNLRGPIPRSISKLVNLRGLYLSNWNTQLGPIDLSIFSHLKSLGFLYLSHLNTTTTIDLNAILSFFKSLEGLDLSGNHVSAETKSSVSDPPSQMIRELNLSGCGITEFPEIIRTLQSMERLDISDNKIKGQVPGWLWTPPNLTYVNLSNNTFVSFGRPTKHGLSSGLWYLSGSRNNFTGKIPSFICALGSLSVLDLSENNFTGKIPSFICALGSLSVLDLSENNFNGSIPLCMENLKSNLSVLNLRQNHLSGGLPENVFESLRSLDVGHNQLVGKLQRSLIHFSALEVLNLESNRFNDTFPFWLSSLQNLQVLVLRSNAFHGPIHRASFLQLKIMDISHNHFNGVLPSDYFVNWSKMSSLGTEKDRSDVNYMGEGTYYEDSMVLMNKGLEMELVRILKIFTALDFSGNRFEGEIPRSIGLLRELHVLNLSNNAFTGHIPSSMGNLTALESLDVSQNKLSGEIPQELGNLSYLSSMNFSHNQLVGLVPGGTQFRTQPCSSFEHNSGLFGPSLDEVCKDIHKPSSQEYETPEEAEEEDEEVFSWIAAAIGFGPGIVLGLTIGYILAFYKPRWFTSPFGRNKHRSRSTTAH